MSLFKLVKQYNAVRLSPYALGQLAAIVIANIARGRAYELAYAVCLHIFAHIQPYHGRFIAEKRRAKRVRKLSLADTRRP